MSRAETFLLDFHRDFPGCTSAAFAHGHSLENAKSSYQLLADLASDDDVLDLGCGDGHLLSLLAPRTGCRPAIGLDLSPHELARAQHQHGPLPLALGRAQRLPFRDSSFSLVLSHFAFHLMGDLDALVDELARVLAPSGRFAAIIGGGPKVGDSFELFLRLLAKAQRDDQRIPPIGEKRARTEDGLRTLFGRHAAFRDPLQFDDYYVDFGGSFDEVWSRLSTVYDLVHFTAPEQEALRDAFRLQLGTPENGHIPCTMAIRRVICSRT